MGRDDEEGVRSQEAASRLDLGDEGVAEGGRAPEGPPLCKLPPSPPP